jgi:hypothetical protein
VLPVQLLGRHIGDHPARSTAFFSSSRW